MSDSWLPRNSSPPGSSVHGISQQQYWSGLPFSYLGDKIFPTRGSNQHFQHLLYWQVDSFNSEPPGSPRVYPNTIVNVLLIFLEEGPRKANRHYCWVVTVGLLPPPPPTVGWFFSLMGISCTQTPSISSKSIPFPPVTAHFLILVMSPNELQLDHELNWRSREWLLCP